jgi:hypothetical protein
VRARVGCKRPSREWSWLAGLNGCVDGCSVAAGADYDDAVWVAFEVALFGTSQTGPSTTYEATR